MSPYNKTEGQIQQLTLDKNQENINISHDTIESILKVLKTRKFSGSGEMCC